MPLPTGLTDLSTVLTDSFIGLIKSTGPIASNLTFFLLATESLIWDSSVFSDSSLSNISIGSGDENYIWVSSAFFITFSIFFSQCTWFFCLLTNKQLNGKYRWNR